MKKTSDSHKKLKGATLSEFNKFLKKLRLELGISEETPNTDPEPTTDGVGGCEVVFGIGRRGRIKEGDENN